MGRSLILSLSFFFLTGFCFCQSAQDMPVKCDCSSKKVKDSLIERYLTNGAEKYNYNGPKWQLYCDSLIVLCPNIAVAYQYKAIPYIKYGDYAKAFPLEDKAVELEPKKWTAYRGFLKCIFTKDYEGAIIDFQNAQRLTPNGYEMDHTYLFYEGLCNLELGNYAKAEENFKQDILIQSGGDIKKQSTVHFNSFLYTGILYYEMKDNDKAKEYLLKCLAIYKELPDANYYLAMLYKRENNTELKNKYLQIAKQAKSKGHDLNEDNVYYAYYPHQVTLHEIDLELQE
jgi:tetratricopeptide (TPR) repeat protein